MRGKAFGRGRSGGAVGAALLLGLAGCHDHDHDHGDHSHGDGTALLEITANGAAGIEQGLAADDFTDGWAVRFTRFEVVVTEAHAADTTFTGPFTADLARPSMGQGHALTAQEVPEGHHGAPSFTLGRMAVAGTATFAAGTADEVVKTFAWTFEGVTAYRDCQTVVHVHADGSGHEGPSGRFEITLHGERLFHDALGSRTPTLQFAAYAAADADADGVVTAAELAAAGVGDLGVGDTAVTNLWGYLEAQAGTLGRANGADPCTVGPP